MVHYTRYVLHSIRYIVYMVHCIHGTLYTWYMAYTTTVQACNAVWCVVRLGYRNGRTVHGAAGRMSEFADGLE